MRGSATVFRAKRAAVSLLFAIAVIPITMLVGLAIDFGFYNEAQAQLDMAADAAAMHAARVASLLLQAQDPDYVAKGKEAGRVWFVSQAGQVPQVSAGTTKPIVNFTGTAANTIEVAVTYTAPLLTHFARLFPVNWSTFPYWQVVGGATAVISTSRFSEVEMLIDNSSSMMIAATDADIQTMEALTPCSAQAVNGDNQYIDGDYSWAYTPIRGQYVFRPPGSAYSSQPIPGFAANDPYAYYPYGYGTYTYSNVTTSSSVKDSLPPVKTTGACDYRFALAGGKPAECPYPPALLAESGGLNADGSCTSKGGNFGSVMSVSVTKAGTSSGISGAAGGTGSAAHMPQAPCAFACHTQAGGNDYYGLAKANNVTLRLDVVQDAASLLIQQMQKSQTSGELSVGVYEFNAPGVSPNGIRQVYPQPGQNASFGTAEAGTDFATAGSLTQGVEPPVTGNSPDTYFEGAMSQLAGFVQPAGDGAVSTAPLKSLFIVTDGMDDYNIGNGRQIVPFDPSSCTRFKTPVSQGGLGFQVYVLYVKYFPLPNPFYLNNLGPLFQNGADPLAANLSQCASKPVKPFFNVSSDGTADSIQKALNSMLVSALGSAGRFTE